MKNLLPTLAIALASFSPLHAATLTWGGGSGGWNFTNANWSDGASLGNWVAGSEAVFGGATGTYAISVDVGTSNPNNQAAAITINTSGYTLQGASSGRRINLLGNFTIASGVTASIGNNLEVYRGNNSISVIGGGTLNIESGGGLNVTGNSSAILNINNGSTVVAKTGGTVTGAAHVSVGNSTTSSTLTISGGTVNASSGTGSNGLRFSGSGTVNLDSGTLNTSRIYTNVSNVTYNSTFNFNGGTLVVSAQNDNTFMTGLTNAYVKEGGALIDTAAFNVNIAQVLQHGGVAAKDGGLTKSGAGSLTLSSINTYTGDTTVSAGTLTLADNAGLKFVIGANGVNNKITGTGTLTLDGDFTFDLTGAATNVGSSWQIVDVSTLTETFSNFFTVVGFTQNSDVWTANVSGTQYQFSEATGVLSVVPEPGTIALFTISGLGLLLFRRRHS